MPARALEKRTFFRARSYPVTGIDVCAVYIAKYTQNHKMTAKIPKFSTLYYLFPRVRPLKDKGHLWEQPFRKEYISPPICGTLVVVVGGCFVGMFTVRVEKEYPHILISVG